MITNVLFQGDTYEIVHSGWTISDIILYRDSQSSCGERITPSRLHHSAQEAINKKLKRILNAPVTKAQQPTISTCDNQRQTI